MRCQEMTLTFEQFALSSTKTVEDRAFRIVLLPGELLRIPKNHRALRVISGDAWVSHDGKDYALRANDRLSLSQSRHTALVSAEGETLFLEVA